MDAIKISLGRAQRSPLLFLSRMHSRNLPSLVSTLLLALLTVAPGAQADSLDGTYKASSLRVSWTVGDWSQGCGPRPHGGGQHGGTVQLRSVGAGFVLEGLGRTYSTNECWEQMPGLAPRSRSAGKSAIQTTCSMPPGDPRRATVTTSWFPQGESIHFDETGQYQFVVGKNTCTASVRRTRTLTRVKRSSANKKGRPSAPRVESKSSQEATQPAPQPRTQAPPPPERTSACRHPGAPVRLEVTPRMKLMRPGEEFRFSAIARDKNGCRAPLSANWTLLGDNASRATLDKRGVLRVPHNAQGGTLDIEATVGEKAVRVGARIVSGDEFERLLAGGSFGTRGESLDAAEIVLSSSHVELEKTGVKRQKKSPLLWLLGGLIVLTASAAILLSHRLRRQRIKGRPTPSRGKILDTPPPPATFEAETRPTQRLCPVCGERYEDETLFCPDDGARLMRVN